MVQIVWQQSIVWKRILQTYRKCILGLLEEEASKND